MKTVAGLVVLLSVRMVYGLTIDVGIISAHFIAAPDSPKVPDNPEDLCEFFPICQISWRQKWPAVLIDITYQSSFSVIHQVGNVGIFVQL